MLTFRATLPWLLLIVSLGVNVQLLHRPSTVSPTLHATSPAASSAPTTHSQLPATSAAPTTTSALPFNPQSATLHSTASRSSAFRGYADLLAEDVKTQEQLSSLNQLLARWVATDPTSAAAWLAQHDDAPFYDPAALHVAKHLVATEQFREAAAWADLIRDPALQEDARDAIVAESFRARKIDASAVRLSRLPASRIDAILNGSRLD